MYRAGESHRKVGANPLGLGRGRQRACASRKAQGAFLSCWAPGEAIQCPCTVSWARDIRLAGIILVVWRRASPAFLERGVVPDLAIPTDPARTRASVRSVAPESGAHLCRGGAPRMSFVFHKPRPGSRCEPLVAPCYGSPLALVWRCRPESEDLAAQKVRRLWLMSHVSFRLRAGWSALRFPPKGGGLGITEKACIMGSEALHTRAAPGRGRDGERRKATWTRGHRAWLPRAEGPHRGLKSETKSRRSKVKDEKPKDQSQRPKADGGVTWSRERSRYCGSQYGAGGLHYQSADLGRRCESLPSRGRPARPLSLGLERRHHRRETSAIRYGFRCAGAAAGVTDVRPGLRVDVVAGLFCGCSTAG